MQPLQQYVVALTAEQSTQQLQATAVQAAVCCWWSMQQLHIAVGWTIITAAASHCHCSNSSMPNSATMRP
jgi:hypothetical protein